MTTLSLACPTPCCCSLSFLSQVAWLQLHTQTSLACPLGVEVVTASGFERLHGFPAAAYADWLALAGKCQVCGTVQQPGERQASLPLRDHNTACWMAARLKPPTSLVPARLPAAGKREASIRGADVGGKAAAKLLARYGSLERALEAAAAGELKGWGPAVQQLLAGPGSDASSGSGSEQQAARLRRNRQLFAANAQPCVVDQLGWQRLAAALESLQPAGAPADWASLAGSAATPSAELAWLQPPHARRWRHLQQLAAQQGGGWQPQQAATPQGFAVDALAVQRGGSGGEATFVVCPCDVAPGGWAKAMAAAGQGGTTEDATRLLMPLLHGAMRHHVKLVQRAGYRVALRLPPGC